MKRQQVLERVESVPQLPTAVGRVLRMIQDPEIGIGAVMDAIEVDPGLTTNVLRLANSAYFAGPRTISSLREAGVRLGMNRVFQLVLATSISPIARKPLRGYDLPAGKLLESLVAVAIATEELGRTAGLELPKHAFTAGLLHDIGKIVLGTFLEVDAIPIQQRAFDEGISFERAEAAVLGIDHAETGAALLEHWQLPEPIVNAVRYSHQPTAIEDDATVVDLVHVGYHLSLSGGLGLGIEGLQYEVSATSVRRLGVSEEQLELAAAQMLTGYEELRPLFLNEP